MTVLAAVTVEVTVAVTAIELTVTLTVEKKGQWKLALGVKMNQSANGEVTLALMVGKKRQEA